MAIFIRSIIRMDPLTKASGSGSSHEQFVRKAGVQSSSDRAFGFVFAAVFAIVAAWPLISGGGVRWGSAAVAFAFALAALAIPTALAPLNRAWARLGSLLHAIVSPVVLAIIFYGVVWPTALVMRSRRRDTLRLKFDHDAATYWIDRVPPGPPPGSFRDPF
jgi:hypothetical protein